MAAFIQTRNDSPWSSWLWMSVGGSAIDCTRKTLILFIPSAVINLLMIASTPLFGSHYAIDIIAGVLVAVVAIYGLREGARFRLFARGSFPISVAAKGVKARAPLSG